jgi:hypothetical protein
MITRTCVTVDTATWTFGRSALPTGERDDSGMTYAVRFVDDQAMPEGRDFVLVQLADDEMVVFYRASAVTARTIEVSWAAYRKLVAEQAAENEAASTATLTLRSA